MYKIGRKRKSENTNRKLMTTTGQMVGSNNSADILLTIAPLCIWTKLPIQMSRIVPLVLFTYVN